MDIDQVLLLFLFFLSIRLGEKKNKTKKLKQGTKKKDFVTLVNRQYMCINYTESKIMEMRKVLFLSVKEDKIAGQEVPYTLVHCQMSSNVELVGPSNFNFDESCRSRSHICPKFQLVLSKSCPY